MNIILLKTVLASALLTTLSVHAGLYKGLDAEGNVVYSDKPFTNAEKLTPPPLSVVDAPKVETKVEPLVEEKTEETSYTKLRIIAPTNNQTIWNEPDLYVKLTLSPELDLKSGHNTWLLLDGKPLVKKSTSLTLPIGRADRGQHSIQAQVRNKDGKILKRSQKVTIHIKNSVVPRAAR